MYILQDLTVEYVREPLGMDAAAPRFGWKIEADTPDWKQKAFRLEVVCVACGKTVWDSGEVCSDATFHIPYDGEPLRPTTRYTVHLTVWDTAGNAAQAETAFETGLMGQISASWIAQQRPRAGWASYLRRNFAVGEGVVSARAYFSGLGMGELYINGVRCGENLLDPMQTNYEKIVHYAAYDVTDALCAGENAVGVLLGDGWFNQSRVWDGGAMSYGDCRMLLELHIRYADGRVEKVLSDGSFTADYSPITLNNIYGGETYDARMEQDGWCTAAFDDARWEPVRLMPAPGGELVCRLMPPVRKLREVRPVRWWRHHRDTIDNVFVFDMGENFAGFVHIRLPYAPAGAECVLRFAEDADEQGALLYASTGSEHTNVLQQDRYISRGCPDGEEWEPRFTYHGFRYVEVSGLHGMLGREMPEDILVGYTVHTALETAGNFACSNDLINRLEALTCHTILDNYHGHPEDCPVRERCGWLGDAQLVCEAAICRFDMAASYEKYLEDIRTSKEIFGQWMMIAPGKRVCHEATPLWASAQVIMPWNMYRYYGDRAALERYYPLMKELIEHNEAVSDGLIMPWGLGDWCPPGGNENTNPHRIPVPVSSTAEFYQITVIMVKVARVLGYDTDAAYFEQLAERIRHAFNARFYNAEAHTYGTQGADGVALAFGLCPDGEDALVAESCRKRMQGDDFAMYTGIYGNKYLVPAMTDHGYGDEIMRMLLNPDHTSFATMLRDGATSVWEWLMTPPRVGGVFSLNHPMQAAFTNWFFTHILGIRVDETAPGFREFVLYPELFGGLTWAKGYMDTVSGRIAVSWTLQNGAFALELIVPANTQAHISLPGHSLQVECGGAPLSVDVQSVGGRVQCTLGSGVYTLRSAL